MTQQIVHRMDSAESVNRYDGSTVLKKVRRTDQGFLVVPATLSRTGVFTYKTSTGKTVRELRPPEEVLHADSIASLKHAPLSVGHRTRLDSGNVQQFSVGQVTEAAPNVEKGAADGELLVTRNDAVTEVEAKRLSALSPGYSCIVDPTPGEYQGQRYDQIQRYIRYNHIALLPKGTGRQGDEVAIRLDANDAIQCDRNEPEGPEHKQENNMEFVTLVLRFDGVDVEIQVPKGMEATVKSAYAKLTQDRNDAKAEVVKTKGALEAKQQELDELQKRYDADTSDEALQSRADARAEVVAKAKELAGDKLETAGKSSHQIRLDALDAAGFEVAEDMSGDEGFVAGMFSVAKKAAAKTAPKVGLPSGAPANRADSKEEKPRTAEQARQEMIERNANLHKGGEE